MAFTIIILPVKAIFHSASLTTIFIFLSLILRFNMLSAYLFDRATFTTTHRNFITYHVDDMSF